MFEVGCPKALASNTSIEDAANPIHHAVSLQFHRPWFHVEYQIISSEKYEPYRVVFLSCHEDLLNLIEQENVKIKNIAIVTPAHINQGHGWKMEKLVEIQKGYEQAHDNKQEVIIYVVENDQCYIDSSFLERNNKVESIDLIKKTRC